MAFISSCEIAYRVSRRGNNVGRGSLLGKEILSISVSDGSKDKRVHLCFTISEELMKKARIIFGDRVDILFDPTDRTGLIKRIKEGGWAVTSSGSNGKNGHKTGHGYIKFTHYGQMPLPKERCLCENVTVNNEGIMFVFPDSVFLPSLLEE